jgi:hypothetical protein
MVVSVLIFLIPAFVLWHSQRTRHVWTGFFIQTRIGSSKPGVQHDRVSRHLGRQAVGQDRSEALESSFTQARIDPVGGVAEIRRWFFRLFLRLAIDPVEAHRGDMSTHNHAIEDSLTGNEDLIDDRMKHLLDRISQAILDRAAADYPSRRTTAPSGRSSSQSSPLLRLV